MIRVDRNGEIQEYPECSLIYLMLTLAIFRRCLGNLLRGRRLVGAQYGLSPMMSQ